MMMPQEDVQMVVENTRHLWEELRGGRIFMTGGTGWIGRWMLESFLYANKTLKLNAEAIVLTRDARGFEARDPHIARASCVWVEEGDCTSFAFPSFKCAHAILMAREPLVSRSVQYALDAGVKKLLYLSSGAVYKRPIDSYGWHKRIAERVCLQAFPVEVKVARCFTFIGPGAPEDAGYAASAFIRAKLRGEELRVVGRGRKVRSFMYMSDLARHLWGLLLAASPGVYDVGASEAVTIKELAERVAGVRGKRVSVAFTNDHEMRERYLPKRRGKWLRDECLISLGDAIVKTLAYVGRQSAAS